MSVSEDKREFTFIWKIENFSMLPHQHKEVLVSPDFEVDMWEGIKWHLELYPRGVLDEELDHMSCFLHATYTEMKDFEVNFSLTLESTDPTQEITSKTACQLRVFVDNNGLGWGNVSSLTKILYEKKDLYLPQDILSLRCHFSPTSPNNENMLVNNGIDCFTSIFKNVYISRTVIQLKQTSAIWPIQNVSTRRDRVEKNFTMKDSPGLKVTLNFIEIANNQCLTIQIELIAPTPLDEKKERFFAKCKITVVGVEKEYMISKENTHLFKSELDDVWHFPSFIKTTNLTRDKYLNQKDTLFLQCEFALSYKNAVYDWDEKSFGFESRQKVETNYWCTRVQNLCASGKFNDFELKDSNETFPVNKLILSASSSVFSAMFENDMKKKTSGVVKIDDVEPPTLKRMLTFINFDGMKEADLSFDDVCKLYEAADKYNVVSLKSWCTQSFLSTLSVHSVYDIMCLADAHHDNCLMTGARNFICCHKTEIFESPAWESFMDSDPKLSAKVMYQVFVNKKRM